MKSGPARSAPEALTERSLGWKPRYLLLAPHRLAFFLAMVLLSTSALWWAWVQSSHFVEISLLPTVVPVSLVHAVLMVFGFFPLFFSGFLFTAGPKWLRVQAWPVRTLCAPLLVLAGGWLTWLAGVHISLAVAFVGILCALGGMAWVTALFWWLLLRSEVDNPVHARVVGVAFLVGTVCIAGVAVGVALGDWALARRFVLSGLWGFGVLVFVTVAHRMLPFFSPPSPHEVHPWGALALLASAAGFEALAVWVDVVLPATPWISQAWALLQGGVELAVGVVLLWRAWGWAKRQSLRNRLMRMFYLGFFWLGLAFLLYAIARGASLVGAAQWQLGALHALGMGCLGSLMLAMVTRVSCGNSGRSQVVDRVLWVLFNVLQIATVLRVVAAVGGAWAPLLLTLAALLWATTALGWALRLGSWYGRLRADGRPG